MNSQNIVVDIGIEKSDPIHYVQGEKGRGISFDIINSLITNEPVDISGYTATIHILKSDGNFTIENMTIDSEHSRAYYTLTENDCAVGGNGIYDISLSKNNELIYTSHGLYCGDNRAVSDDVVNSVSVAYGVTFPEGFQEKLIAGDGIHITDNVISATGESYTAGDGINITENNEITLTNAVIEQLLKIDTKQNALTAGDNITIENNVISADTLDYYSTDDIIIGKWVDGRNIYRRVIGNGSPIQTGVDVSSLNIDYVINIDGITGDGLTPSSSNDMSCESQYSYIESNTIGFNKTYNTLSVIPYSGFNIFYIIIEYVKNV